MKQKSRNLILQPRDHQVFYYLFKHKIALAYQIQRDIFGDAHKVVVYQRLRRLIAKQLLGRGATITDERSANFYYLTPKGLLQMQKESELDLVDTQLRSDSQIHDYTLVDLISRFEKFPFVSRILCENELVCRSWPATDDILQVFSKERSDAFLELEINKERLSFALEYEQSRKSKKIFFEKLFRYSVNSRVDGVIYCLPDQSFLDFVASSVKSLPENEHDKFLFCLRDELLASKDELVLVTSAGRKLTLA